MGANEASSTGFGTTQAEWELLRQAYNLAVAMAGGDTPSDEALARFRALDESSSLMFSDWWSTRVVF